MKALHQGIKRVVLCWHRRSGKDLTIFNWVIEQLIAQSQVCFYIFPSYSQAKKAIWDSKDNDGIAFLDYIPQEFIANKNAQEMKIRFKNGSLLQLVGSDNVSSLMGSNPRIVVFSEYALQKTEVWDFIRPILRVNRGFAIFISTPRGRNHFWEIYRVAQRTEDWFHQKLTYKDTDVLSDADIEKEREEGMSDEMVEQEYNCSFDRGIEGSYYASLITKMHFEDRITADIVYDPYKLVHVSYDLGWDDDTALIFFQIQGDFINIIDAEAFRYKTLAEVVHAVKDKKYKYGYHLFPHDVEITDGLSTGCTRREILENLDITVTTVDKTLIVEGIEVVRMLLSSRIRIHSNCQKLIQALEQYHKEYNEVKQIYSNKPVHDHTSHYADSMRYLAMGLHKIPISTSSSLQDDAKALRAFWG